MGTSDIMLGVIVGWTSIPSRGGGGELILLGVSCHTNQVKGRLFRPNYHVFMIMAKSLLKALKIERKHHNKMMNAKKNELTRQNN